MFKNKLNGKAENVDLTNAIAKGGAIYVPLAEAQNQLQEVVKVAKKRTYTADPNQLACSAGMRKFAALPAELQDTKTKLACIICVLVARKIDNGRFWSWVNDQTTLLRRTFDFDDVCKEHGKDAQHVAEHLVMEGKKVCNSIRLDGLSTYKGDINLFGDPLIPEEYRKLFSKTFEAPVVEEAPVEEEVAGE